MSDTQQILNLLTQLSNQQQLPHNTSSNDTLLTIGTQIGAINTNINTLTSLVSTNTTNINQLVSKLDNVNEQLESVNTLLANLDLKDIASNITTRIMENSTVANIIQKKEGDVKNTVNTAKNYLKNKIDNFSNGSMMSSIKNGWNSLVNKGKKTTTTITDEPNKGGKLSSKKRRTVKNSRNHKRRNRSRN